MQIFNCFGRISEVFHFLPPIKGVFVFLSVPPRLIRRGKLVRASCPTETCQAFIRYIAPPLIMRLHFPILQKFGVQLSVSRLPGRIRFYIPLIPHVFQASVRVISDSAVLNRLFHVLGRLCFGKPRDKLVPAIRVRQRITAFEHRLKQCGETVILARDTIHLSLIRAAVLTALRHRRHLYVIGARLQRTTDRADIDALYPRAPRRHRRICRKRLFCSVGVFYRQKSVFLQILFNGFLHVVNAVFPFLAQTLYRLVHARQKPLSRAFYRALEFYVRVPRKRVARISISLLFQYYRRFAHAQRGSLRNTLSTLLKRARKLGFRVFPVHARQIRHRRLKRVFQLCIQLPARRCAAVFCQKLGDVPFHLLVIFRKFPHGLELGRFYVFHSSSLSPSSAAP